MAPAFSGEIVDVSYVALGADGSPLATTPAPTAPVPAPAPAPATTALPSGDTTVNSTNGTCFIESYVYNQSSAPTPAPTPVPTPPPMQTTTTTTTATATATVYTGIQAGDVHLTAYWDSGACGPMGDDYQWDWCGKTAFSCRGIVATPHCTDGYAELQYKKGTG